MVGTKYSFLHPLKPNVETLERNFKVRYFISKLILMKRATFAILFLVMHFNPSEHFLKLLTTSKMNLLNLEIYNIK